MIGLENKSKSTDNTIRKMIKNLKEGGDLQKVDNALNGTEELTDLKEASKILLDDPTMVDLYEKVQENFSSQMEKMEMRIAMVEKSRELV